MFAFLMVIEDTDIRSKLEELYIKYHKEMYFKAFQILKHTQDSQDVVQESILKLAKYIHKIDDIESYKTKGLVYMIVRNYAIDIYRHKQKHAYVPIDDLDSEPVDDVTSLDDLMIQLCEAERLAMKISELNIEYAEILTLKYYCEFTDLEIADLINISYENVRTRLRRSKLALRKLIENNSEATA